MKGSGVHIVSEVKAFLRTRREEREAFAPEPKRPPQPYFTWFMNLQTKQSQIVRLSEMIRNVFDLHPCAVNGACRIGITEKHITHSQPTGDVSYVCIFEDAMGILQDEARSIFESS